MKGIFDFGGRGLSTVKVDGLSGLVGFTSARDMVEALAALGGRPKVFFHPAGGGLRLAATDDFLTAPKGADDFRRKTPSGVYELGWLEDR